MGNPPLPRDLSSYFPSVVTQVRMSSAMMEGELTGGDRRGDVGIDERAMLMAISHIRARSCSKPL